MKKILVVVVGLLIISLGFNGYLIVKWREEMRVVRVIDGDTFVIKTGERVRLVGLDAPEAGSCGSEEATKRLSDLTLNKVIRLNGAARDRWGRRLGMVYVGRTNVNLEMVKSGWARFDNFEGGGTKEVEEAGIKAQEGREGIFGKVCKVECSILGNIDQSSGKKYYHLPDCPSWGRVRISPERGERKFCTETEASKAGFSLAPDCLK